MKGSKQGRAYSVLEIKEVDEKARRITGWATTPSPDRMDDIVVPEGAQYKLPIPLLWQHDSHTPIGFVTEATVSAKGIKIVAEIAQGVTEDIEKAWALIKAGLVRGLSIGFRGLEWSDIAGTWGVKFTAWEWLELSAVTIPANAEANITSVKKFDTGLPAPKSAVQLVSSPPGATGTMTTKTQPVEVSTTPRPKEGLEMKTIAEQIAALEATRAGKSQAMQAVMQKSIDGGRSTDTAEQEEFDGLAAEVEALDADLKRLRTLEKAMAATAAPVSQVVQRSVAPAEAGAAVRDVNYPAAVRVKQKSVPGVRFARLAKVKALSRLENENAIQVAERMYGADSEVFHIVKAAVVAGSTLDGNWASALVGDETTAFADFVSYLRPATILGKFGLGGIPGLRQVPFREPLIAQTGGGSGYWVGEGKPKPLTAFNFTRDTLEPLKVANIAVLTEENVRSSNPSSELIVRDALRDALVETQDVAFIDPANAGTANVKPASILNGAEVIVAQSYTDADDIRTDVRAVFQKFIDANNPPQSGVWIMSATNALALSLILNPLGQREFPGMTMNGGTFEGLPVIVSQYIGSVVALVNASDIYEADEGGIAVDMSREASLEMSDAPAQNGLSGTGASMVSLWQSNLVGLRAERTINWRRRRASAVAYLTGVIWGGPVPAS